MIRTQHFIVATLTLALWACSPEQPEAKLEQAAQELREAVEETDEAMRELSDAQDELRAERAEVEAAEKALRQARRLLRERRKALAGEQADLQAAASDTAIFRLLQTRLLDAPELDELAIAGTVLEGRVTLYGDVPEKDQRDAAQRIAVSVPGVVEVNNLIEVAGPPGQ